MRNELDFFVFEKTSNRAPLKNLLVGVMTVFCTGCNILKNKIQKISSSFICSSEPSDSHMFVVRLPPHHPFYSNLHPEKLENEVIKKPMSFNGNGKPAQVYHWNMPLMKKLAKHKKNKHDSKILRLNIVSNEDPYEYYKKLKKTGKPSLYKLKKDHVMSIKELAEHQNDMPEIKPRTAHQNEILDKDSHVTRIVLKNNEKNFERRTDSMLTFIKHQKHHPNSIEKFENSKKTYGKTPFVYSPSIPKHNSFHKYFPGNGKPKSFYVIEDSKSPSRYHRLL